MVSHTGPQADDKDFGSQELSTAAIQRSGDDSGIEGCARSHSDGSEMREGGIGPFF
jgi:hypothetical protein